jgi:hypothetical protein
VLQRLDTKASAISGEALCVYTTKMSTTRSQSLTQCFTYLLWLLGRSCVRFSVVGPIDTRATHRVYSHHARVRSNLVIRSITIIFSRVTSSPMQLNDSAMMRSQHLADTAVLRNQSSPRPIPGTPLSILTPLAKGRSTVVMVGLLVVCFVLPAMFVGPATTTPALIPTSDDRDSAVVEAPEANLTTAVDVALLAHASPPSAYDATNVDDMPQPPPSQQTFAWQGGGVRGPAEDALNHRIDEDHQLFIDSLKHDINIDDVQAYLANLANGPPLPSEKEQHGGNLKRSLLSFITDYVARTANNASSHQDCFYHLLPHHVWMCHMWGAAAVAQEGSAFLHHDAMRKSLCGLLMSCAAWRRGTFTIPLTPTFLQNTFQSVVQRVRHASSSRPASNDGVRVAIRNLVHGGNNTEEYRWLGDRAAIEVSDIAKRKTLFLKAQTLKRTLRKLGFTDARAVFQGGELGMDPASLTMTSRENGSPQKQTVSVFSALDTMAVLYHRASRGGHFDHDFDCTSHSKPPIRMIVFSGDSLTRELFNRLVHHLRYGVQAPVIRVRNPSTNVVAEQVAGFRWMPFFEVPAQEDFVYSVFSTHDDYTMFSSVAHDHSNKATVNRFFVDLAAQLLAEKARRCGDGEGTKRSTTTHHNNEEGAALMYIVFLWDPFTQRPRRDPLAPCASPLHMEQATSRQPLRFLFFRKHKHLDVAPRIEPIPFRSLGARIGLHLHGAAYWERVQHPNLLEHWASMALNCRLVEPIGGGAEALRHHPVSDDTHLYLLTSASSDPLGIAKIPPYYGPPLMAHSTDLMAPSKVNPVQSGAVHVTDERMLRTARMFDWLRDVVANESAVGRHSSSTPSPTKFYTKVRLLDKGKVPYVPGNVFARVDGTHLSCHGYTRVVGGALQDTFYDSYTLAVLFGNRAPSSAAAHTVVKEPHQFLKRLRDVLLSANFDVQVKSRLGPTPNSPEEVRGRNEPFGFLPLANGTKGYLRPEHRVYDQCGDFGNFFVLNTMLHDIVADAARP